METKVCSKCNKEKNISEFYKRKDKFDAKCISCVKLYNNVRKLTKQRYDSGYGSRRKEHSFSTSFKLMNQKRTILKEEIIQLMGGGCIKCGYNKCLSALEFHHIETKTKIDNICNLITNVSHRSDKHYDKLIKELQQHSQAY
jgi:hypothetical protein